MSLPRRSASAVTALLVSAALLSGCGSKDQQEANAPTNPQTSAGAAEIKLPTSRPSKNSSSKKPTPTATPSPSTPQVQVPEGAYADAGGPKPANATPVTSVNPSGIAVIKTPSNNIGCDLSASYAGCGVLNYQQSKPYGSDEGGAKWWVPLDGSFSQVHSKGDAPYFLGTDPAPQVLPYGTVVYHENYVCASEQNGLTCWDTNTGHGAFMNRDGTSMF